MPDSTPLPPLSPSETPRTSPPKRRRWALWGCGGLLALVLIIVATVAITIWWIQRPIKPVVLSAAEKQVVESKLQQVRSAPVATRDERLSPAPRPNPAPGSPSNRYVAGGKELRLTERELNGLLNENTDLGKTVRLELDTDAINAYLAVPIPKDFPIGGGRMFRAKGRFRMSLSQDQAPVAMLEDVTVLGLSLPKEWLGGVKGKNLLADAMGERSDAPTWKGIKSLRIVPGAIVLQVGD
jgi:hypothetical protein